MVTTRPGVTAGGEDIPTRLRLIHCGRHPGHGIGHLQALGLEFLKRDGCRLVCCVAAALEISKPRGECGAGH